MEGTYYAGYLLPLLFPTLLYTSILIEYKSLQKTTVFDFRFP